MSVNYTDTGVVYSLEERMTRTASMYVGVVTAFGP